MGYLSYLLAAYVGAGVFLLIWNGIVWLHYRFDWD